jgi:hypothetical protein
MGIIDELKALASLALDMKSRQLHEKVMGLMTQVYDLHDENRTLREQVHELREKLTEKERTDEILARRMHRSNAYWVDGDGPYCTGCWDGKDRQTRMATFSDGRAECPVCKSMVHTR